MGLPNYSMPLEMVVKTFYCSKCGAILDKEMTHRVVSPDDKDYYKFQETGTRHKYEHDVYEWRFKCPTCKARVSYKEQRIINKIQKKNKSKVLSSMEIKNDFNKYKKKNERLIIFRDILLSLVITAIFVSMLYFLLQYVTKYYLIISVSLYAVLTISEIFGYFRARKGKKPFLGILKSYANEEESQAQILHAYSSHNRELINGSNKCYCFYCKNEMSSMDIEKYIDEGETAICPKCGVDAIIPDAVEKTIIDKIDENVIDNMNKYWF